MLANDISKAVFEGNNSATEFPFTFKVWDKNQLVVEVTDPLGLTYAVYTWAVSLTESGGTLTYVHEGAPLPDGYKLAILRNMPFLQGVDLINGTRFDPTVIEEALDKATAERQQLKEAIERSLKLDASSIYSPDTLIQELRDNTAASTSAAVDAAASSAHALSFAEASAASATAAQKSADAAAKFAAEAGNAAGEEAVARVVAEGDTQVTRVKEEGGAILSTMADLARTAFIPGMVVAFSGSFGGEGNVYPIPTGSTEPDLTWKLHEPSRGKFILGGTGQNQGEAGEGGDTESFTLTSSHMPSHTHSTATHSHSEHYANVAYGLVGEPFSQDGHVYGDTAVLNVANATTATSSVTVAINATGSNQAHSHSQTLPPYYTLAYIEKLAVENPSGGHAVFVTHEEFQEGLADRASQAELNQTNANVSDLAAAVQSLQNAVQSSQQEITSLKAQVSALEQATPSYALKTEIPDITGLATKQELAGKADVNALDDKQNTLVPGANITIDENNVISSTASGNDGVPEAPVDGKLYGRKNQAWAEVTGAVTPPPEVTPTVLTQDGKTFTTSNNVPFEVLGE